MNTKKELRAIIKHQLLTLTPSEMKEKSDIISRSVFNLPVWQESKIILSYAAMKGEVSTQKINRRALEEGKILGVPRMYGDVIRFHRVLTLKNSDEIQEWEEHPWGIMEPKADLPVLDPVDFTSPALLITPGLGFDSGRGRLGRGKGYYDRFISSSGAKIFPVGIGFSRQMVKKASFDSHDQPLKIVVTDEGIY